ncbi:hypothetical protein O6H91_03G070100 [Diphasiastrum complanatum]|uniref:Uncharacterized protein n=1 Tax=Diphasiastrum complanatum TaxID=34168 RepID=A0ACC2E770_DIPCM|nr:hypothetical protein O6H91_03G070100 [Diphasiastrum complanatum]
MANNCGLLHLFKQALYILLHPASEALSCSNEGVGECGKKHYSLGHQGNHLRCPGALFLL